MSNPGRRRVAVTGVGLVNPFGGDAQDFFARLMRGESAVRLYHHPASPSPLAQPAVSCPHFDPELVLGRPLAGVMDRYSQLGVAAAFSAWDDAGLPRQGAGSDEYGVSWGTGVGGTLTFERGYTDFYVHGKDRAHPLSIVLAMNNAAASHVAISLGLGSACLTYSVACASSAVSIGEAMRRIQAGESQLVVAGGSEAPLSFSVMRAWEAMRVVGQGNEETAYRACRPFQNGRTGLVLGEGGAALILEDWEHAVARGARIYCELAGYGQSCDHSHLVKPDAYGQTRAMKLALREAGLAPEEIGYVNAHGTATREGDPTEIDAVRQIFGAHAENLLVSATKSMHGHLLGATGAMEALITVLALARGEVPPTAHLDDVAADCTGVRHVMGAGLRDVPLKAALSNSFAFGGSNAVLAFKAAA
ncbi:beta-ketoacyl-[acyl-carrier-protein] synthase family protein [Uliginosibacterium sp. 31-16]|uniref:beta-ketoacyl-[acyl-carrier-protein] synthase family protein n=1 Tax=Uliginosibacterium sp. 31-16 TaxID=3068315 RepID=UPI00273FBB74|nr:beta-ketoacyl-[acyl-carrier-protein] synthase family protein [Uliginosibacterium sp. 31-16]MDP5239223.1 beta-ketoacyl-[acyl-carrier-protein] synthase family protein [Uliginosibacterium sp. 31-16]